MEQWSQGRDGPTYTRRDGKTSRRRVLYLSDDLVEELHRIGRRDGGTSLSQLFTRAGWLYVNRRKAQ